MSRGDVEFYLPGLREVLLDPANSDDALTNLIVRRARRGTFDGTLIALLAANRPATLVGLSERLNPFPKIFETPGPVLDEMEKNPKFRNEFADTMFLVLQLRPKTPEDTGRFLKLMETSHPGWLCDKLGRMKGSTELSKILQNEAVERNSRKCSR